MPPPAKPLKVAQLKVPKVAKVAKPKVVKKPALTKAQKLIAKADKKANLETFGIQNGSKAKFIANFKKLKKLDA